MQTFPLLKGFVEIMVNFSCTVTISLSQGMMKMRKPGNYSDILDQQIRETYGFVLALSKKLVSKYSYLRIDPEDLAHEVYIVVLQKKNVFVDHPYQKGWLGQITLNKFREMKRSRQRINALSVFIDPERKDAVIESIEDPMVISSFDASVEILDDNEEKLKKALSSLSKQDQALFDATYVQELSDLQICEIENITPTTLRKRRSRLRKKIEKECSIQSQKIHKNH